MKIASHPAKDALVALTKKYPDVHKLIDAVVCGDRAEWDRRVFLPLELRFSIAGYLNKSVASDALKDATLYARLDEIAKAIGVLGAWSKTQGIYRFDSDIYEELVSTPLEGAIPTSVLTRLPEWCIYIELDPSPLSSISEHLKARGVWVTLSARLETPEGLCSSDDLSLFIVPDLFWDSSTLVPPAIAAAIRSMMLAQSIPLSTDTTLDDLIGQAVNDANAQLAAVGDVELVDILKTEEFSLMKSFLTKVLNLVIFICTQDDVQNTIGQRPVNPIPKKTKKGVRLFAPDTPSEWQVGVRMGSALRRAKAMVNGVSNPESGSSVRPHVRRAHWHSFRVGRRKDSAGAPIPLKDQEIAVKWLPSLPINLPDGMELHELPAVIHRVS